MHHSSYSIIWAWSILTMLLPIISGPVTHLAPFLPHMLSHIMGVFLLKKCVGIPLFFNGAKNNNFWYSVTYLMPSVDLIFVQKATVHSGMSLYTGMWSNCNLFKLLPCRFQSFNFSSWNFSPRSEYQTNYYMSIWNQMFSVTILPKSYCITVWVRMV